MLFSLTLSGWPHPCPVLHYHLCADDSQIFSFSSYLFSQFQLRSIFNCLLPLQTTCPTSTFNSHCWVESIILFSQTYFPSRTPTSIIMQAKSRASFCLLSLPLFTTSGESFKSYCFSFLSHSHYVLHFLSHWYSRCLIFCLGYYYPLLTNYHGFSSAFCNLSSIRLPEYIFKMQLLSCHSLDYNSFEPPPPTGWSPDSSAWC